MAKRRYSLEFFVDSSRARSEARGLTGDLRAADLQASRLAASMGRAFNQSAATARQAVQQVTAAIQQANQAAGGRGRGGGGSATAAAQQQANQLDAIQDRLFKRDYSRRVAYEARKQKEAQRSAQAAVTAQQAELDQLDAIQDRLTRKDYTRRVAFEARKQKEASQASARAAADQQRQADQLDAVQDRLAKKDYDRRVAYEAKKQKEADRATAQATAQQQRQADRLDAVQDRLIAKDQRRRTAYEARKLRDKERNEAQLAAIEDRYLMEEYRKRGEYLEKRQAQDEAAASAQEAMIAKAAAATLAAALKGLQMLMDGYKRIREDAVKAAEATTQLRKELRVEATLKGEGAPTTKALIESLQFRAQTGLDQAAATDFTRQYIGTVPIAFQKGNISEQVSKDLMVKAGIMSARQGGDAGTRGELAGILGQFGKVTSAQQGLGQLESIRIALTEGRGDDTPLTQQLLDAAGATVREGGPVGTLPELAALIGVTSLTNPGEASMLTKQLIRGVRTKRGKMSKPKGAKESQGQYLQRLGVKENDSLEAILDKVVPDLQAAQASGRDIEGYLTEHGFSQSQERLALTTFVPNYEAFKKRMAASRQAGQGAAVEQQNQAFLASPYGRQVVADVQNKISEQEIGLRTERFNTLMSEAAGTKEFQEANQSIGTGFKDRAAGYAMGDFADPEAAGKKMRQFGIATRILREREDQAGVTEDERTQVRMRAYQEGGSSAWEVAYVDLMERLIEQKGGSNQAETQATMDRLTEALRANTEAVVKQNQQMGGQGAPRAVAPMAPAPLPRP